MRLHHWCILIAYWCFLTALNRKKFWNLNRHCLHCLQIGLAVSGRCIQGLNFGLRWFSPLSASSSLLKRSKELKGLPLFDFRPKAFRCLFKNFKIRSDTFRYVERLKFAEYCPQQLNPVCQAFFRFFRTFAMWQDFSLRFLVIRLLLIRLLQVFCLGHPAILAA